MRRVPMNLNRLTLAVPLACARSSCWGRLPPLNDGRPPAWTSEAGPGAPAQDTTLPDLAIPSPESLRALPRPAHPYLMPSEARFAELKEQIAQDSLLRRWYADVKAQADDYLDDDRGIALLNGRTQVLVQDELEAEEPVDLWWFMHTEADVQLSEDSTSALLAQDGKRLRPHCWRPTPPGSPSWTRAPSPARPTPRRRPRARASASWPFS